MILTDEEVKALLAQYEKERKIPDDLRSDTPRALSGNWYSAGLIYRTIGKFGTPIFDRLAYELQAERERNGWDMSYLAV